MRPTTEQANKAPIVQDMSDDELPSAGGYKRHAVQWYPGHIAKAERQLAKTLKVVDVVVEVRDARACKASSHAKVGEWCAGRPRIVALTHSDQIPKLSIVSWKRSYETFGAGRWDGAVTAQVVNQAKQAQQERRKYFATSKKLKQKNPVTTTTASPVENVVFVDAKMGQGVRSLVRAIIKAGQHVQKKRERKGLRDRPLRVGIIGYPNVGKSALINRILGRRRARTADTPGITRTLQWIRVRADEAKTSRKNDFELLDSPGVIPARLTDQSDANLLAACNCVGNNAYDNQNVAAYLLDWLMGLHRMGKGKLAAPKWVEQCKARYKLDPTKENWSGDELLHLIAANTCRGIAEDASRKILQDFRTGRLGPICLQLAPKHEEDDGHVKVDIKSQDTGDADQEALRLEERQARAAAAIETAKKKGLELPPVVENQETAEQDVGKGMFDGW